MTKDQYLDLLEKKLKLCLTIARAKNADYAVDSDPFKNFRLCEALGVSTVESGMIVRMSDKLSRITNLLSKEASVKDESIHDTLLDLANYSIILSNYIESKQKKS